MSIDSGNGPLWGDGCSYEVGIGNTGCEILKSLLTSPKMQTTKPVEVNIVQALETRTETEEQIVFQIELGQQIKSEFAQDENIIQHIPVTYLTTDNPTLAPTNGGTYDEPVTYVLSHDLIPDTQRYCTTGTGNPQKVFFVQEVDSNGQTLYVDQEKKLYAVKERQTNDRKHSMVWNVDQGVDSHIITSSTKHENEKKRTKKKIGKQTKRDEESFKTKADKRISTVKKSLSRWKSSKSKNKLKGGKNSKKALKSAEEEIPNGGKEKVNCKRSLFELTKLEDNVEEVAQRLENGCECSDSNCFEGLNPDEVFKHRLNIADLTKAEHDMYLMGIIMASIQNLDLTCKHKERLRIRSFYAYQGKKVCLTAFLYLQHVTVYQMKRLRSHLKSHGVSPRIHGNRGRKPANTFSLDAYRRATNFVQSYIEKHNIRTVSSFTAFSSNKVDSVTSVGEDTPAEKKKIKKIKVTSYYLPPECTKRTVHREYKSFCEKLKPSQKVMKYSTFTNFLKKQFPNVKFPKREDRKPERMATKSEEDDGKQEEEKVDKSIQVDKTLA